jgi:fatty acid desaturase
MIDKQAQSRSQIPNKINIALALLSTSTASFLLWFASHTDNWLLRIAGAIAFSYVANTVFALLHEAVHGVLNHSDRVNTMLGRWLAAFFPTSFTLQRKFHLGHHSRNRTRAERFDYIAPGESVLLKNIQWYGILTGLYWLLPPLSCIIFFISPRFFSSRFIQGEDAAWSHQSGTDAMVAEVVRLPRATVRLEILFVALWQTILFVVLHLNWIGWGMCYAAFAVNWSSLQYADHAWSSLDTVEGAWNLRANSVVRWFFLNYHHHKAHHMNPKISWIHLPTFVNDDEPRPSFLRIYLSMWRGPRPLPKGSA